MIIRAMTATFGCLDGAELRLEPGVNRLILPNESGKSTWIAFLTAMLYGIDTTQRAAKGRLPDKTRYAPWDGKPMEGVVELEHRGQTIVLQRTSTRTRPMSHFRAWDKETGLDIPGLTGENCGQVLLGVERSVFLRSALLRGEELLVTRDQELSRRLAALASGEEESDGFPQADQRLRQWQTKIRYNRTGLLPEAETRLNNARDRQRQREELRRQREDTAAQRKELMARTGDGSVENLPSEEALLHMRQLLAAPIPEPPAVPALETLTPEDLLPRAQRDTNRLRSPLSRLSGLLTLAALAGGGALALAAQWLLAGGLLLLAALCGGVWLHCRRQRRALLAAYGVEAPEELVPLALTRRDALLERERAQREREALLAPLRALYPELAPQKAVELALTRRRRARESAEALAQARTRTQLRLEELDRRLSQPEDAPDTLPTLEKRVEELRLREEALVLAREALAEADRRLRQDYSPRLTRLAGRYIQTLTGGRYDGLSVDEQWQLTLRESASGLTRPAAALSRGTQDQAWLALRLTMTELLIPEDAPLLLDDALLAFDPAREAAALQALEETSRQVLLFSCR